MLVSLQSRHVDWKRNTLALGIITSVDLIPTISLLIRCYRAYNSALVLHL